MMTPELMTATVILAAFFFAMFIFCKRNFTDDEIEYDYSYDENEFDDLYDGLGYWMERGKYSSNEHNEESTSSSTSSTSSTVYTPPIVVADSCSSSGSVC